MLLFLQIKFLQKLYKTFYLQLWLIFNWILYHIHCLTMFISLIDINQMASSGRCLNDPGNFCYTYGEFTPKANRKLISDFYKNAYRAYFQVELGDQDKKWAPHIVCKTCLENMRLWTSGKLKSLRHSIPMPQNHLNHCYFCSVSIAELNQKKSKSVTYPSIPTAIQPVPHSNELPALVFQKDWHREHDESDSAVMDKYVGYDPDFVEESVFSHLVKASSMTWYMT